MNQEMTDVPEYRQIQNGPSKSSEREAYDKGLREGYNQGLSQGFMQALANCIDILVTMQRKFLEGTQNDRPSTGNSANCTSSPSSGGDHC